MSWGMDWVENPMVTGDGYYEPIEPECDPLEIADYEYEKWRDERSERQAQNADLGTNSPLVGQEARFFLLPNHKKAVGNVPE